MGRVNEIMTKKTTYKIKNWKDYNKSLIKRGNITVWFNEKSINTWYASNDKHTKGHPDKYSDTCIKLALTIKNLLRFPLRATQGFLEGMVSMMELELDVPNYSSYSRRASRLNVDLSYIRKSSSNIDIVVDSTGLKIYGEGEWKVRIHGKGKQRTWRKLHVAINPDSHQTVSMELTKADVADCTAMPKLVKGLKKIKNMFGDGGYTSKDCFDAIANIGAKPVIAIRSGLSLAKNPSKGLKERNRIIREFWKAGGREQWKKISNYHKRSVVETHMFRLKTIFGEKLSSRKFENQVTEARIRTSILNQMTNLGMPLTVDVK